MNTTEKVALALLSMQRHSWEQGVAMQAFLEMGQKDTVIAMAYEAVYRSTADGRCATIGFTEAITDPCSVGEALLAAAQWTGDDYLINGSHALLHWALKDAPRNKDGVLYHLTTGTEFWADSFYMLPPFLVCAGEYTAALQNFYGYWNALYDHTNHLLRHMWDDAKKIYIRSAHWGTGNGWALAAMARMLPMLYEAGYQNDADTICNYAKELLDGVLHYLRPDGFFHDVLDDPNTFVETNLSQMTAYSIYRGVADGWLSQDYLAEAEQMRKAARSKVNAYGLVCDACGAPHFDKPGQSPEAQAFYLLMEQAALSMSSSS